MLNGKVIYENAVLLDKNFKTLNFSPKMDESSVRVSFQTPLRVKQNTKFLKNIDQISF
ncbi:MAG: hypothetical protein MR902_07930 [Campylobacter sp.]|nr:hypothetical protein [Campylobacter sp.]